MESSKEIETVSIEETISFLIRLQSEIPKKILGSWSTGSNIYEFFNDYTFTLTNKDKIIRKGHFATNGKYIYFSVEDISRICYWGGKISRLDLTSLQINNSFGLHHSNYNMEYLTNINNLKSYKKVDSILLLVAISILPIFLADLLTDKWFFHYDWLFTLLGTLVIPAVMVIIYYYDKINWFYDEINNVRYKAKGMEVYELIVFAILNAVGGATLLFLIGSIVASLIGLPIFLVILVYRGLF